MAQVTNFKDRIADYAGSLAETDDDALKQYTIDCCQEIIKLLGVKQSDDLFKFTIKSGNISDSVPIDVVGKKTIAGVVRNNVMATEGNAMTGINYKDEGSIYFASKRDPKFWIENGSLNIAPEPSGSEQAHYLYIPEFTVENFDSGTTVIKDVDTGSEVFPQKYHEALILSISLKVLNRRLNDYLENDEDIELVNGIQSQIARFDQEYQKIMGIEPKS